MQDDYVKFIRFAQWKIDAIGEGVLGFVTNHSYLDNPTFRGMRQSLLKSFSKIYILNLRGNSLKKEKCPDGSKDENVFDIQQGVAIILAIKKQGGNEGRIIQYSDCYGLRDQKYEWLSGNSINETKWQELQPTTPYYFLIPRNEAGSENYSLYKKLPEIFPINITGVVTSRDDFVIDFGKQALLARILTFRNKELSDDTVKEGLKLKENYMWRVSKARKELMADDKWNEHFTKILYRPFDVRDIYYHPSVVWRTRKEVMSNMMRENLGLISPKQSKETAGAFVSNSIIGHKTVSAYDINYIFPLYIYPSSLFSKEDRKPNIEPYIFAALNSAYKKKISPEDIFYYVYGILYSNAYREKYAQFLKFDFPRIPFTKDYSLFMKLSAFGMNLTNLHLLKASELDNPVARYQGKGDNRIEKPAYNVKKKQVNINKTQFFEGLLQDVWSYQVGGYQVCDKWLKDRKERILSLDEIQTYCRIVTSIQKTIEIQKAIDEIYDEIEASII